MAQIILAGGCFWCVQAVFQGAKGVKYTEVGYSGGADNPNYRSVCAGDGNIEVVKIDYDTQESSLEQILDLFFKMHDPTSMDRQGNDIGIQYRSAIFYQDEEDRIRAKNFIASIQKNYDKPILTQIYKLKKYYKAEQYHQDYFIKNPQQAYCKAVIAPKVEKLK